MRVAASDGGNQKPAIAKTIVSPQHKVGSQRENRPTSWLSRLAAWCTASPFGRQSQGPRPKATGGDRHHCDPRHDPTLASPTRGCQMGSIVTDATGLEPWPKLFHNLRATRQTELQERFPSHVVCKWIGNSSMIAAKHYLQVTEEHFRAATAPNAAQQQAARDPVDSSHEEAEGQQVQRGAESGARHAPTRGMQSSASTRKESQKTTKALAGARASAEFDDGAGYPLGESNPCYRTENPMS
jgi:hypothetical protein